MALGKPAIATPNQLDLRAVQGSISNIRQRIEALESSLNTTSATANTTVNSTAIQISALQQAVAALTVEVNSLVVSGTIPDDAGLILATQIFGA